jgi:hypothetical protein
MSVIIDGVSNDVASNARGTIVHADLLFSSILRCACEILMATMLPDFTSCSSAAGKCTVVLAGALYNID